MFHKLPRKMGLSLALLFCLLKGLILPVQAASQPVITQLDVLVNRRIKLQIDYLPVNTEFAVTEGSAGSQGIGHLIAHFNSGLGGTQIYWFEVLSNINTDANIDVRIDNGHGIFAYATVANTASFTAPATVPVPNVPASAGSTPVPINPITHQPLVSTIGQISVVKVEQGGIVVVDLRSLPSDTTFTVTLNLAGTYGIGGYAVGELTTPSSLAETISTFEIPAPLRSASVLDLRLDSGGYVYVIEFDNQNFNN